MKIQLIISFEIVKFALPLTRAYTSSLRLGASRHPPQEAADEYKPNPIADRLKIKNDIEKLIFYKIMKKIFRD